MSDRGIERAPEKRERSHLERRSMEITEESSMKERFVRTTLRQLGWGGTLSLLLITATACGGGAGSAVPPVQTVLASTPVSAALGTVTALAATPTTSAASATTPTSTAGTIASGAAPTGTLTPSGSTAGG